MNIPAPQHSNQALQLLSHYVPRDVLAKARNLAQKYEQEEAFRAYLLKKIWVVLPAAFLFFAFSVAVVVLLYIVIARLAPDASLLRAIFIILAIPLVIAGFLLQIYLLFSKLQQRAEREGVLPRTIES